MNTQRKLMILATVLAFLTTLPVARASELDQATKLTFNKAVQIPGRVLPAGTYWFVLAETNSVPNVVQVFNSDRSTLYATILTINAERSNPTDKTAITFAEVKSHSSCKSLRRWSSSMPQATASSLVSAAIAARSC